MPSDDPLVLDLNGDRLVSRGIGATWWDNDGDLFGEKSGWLSGDDGFMVHDTNGDGRVTADERSRWNILIWNTISIELHQAMNDNRRIDLQEAA